MPEECIQHLMQEHREAELVLVVLDALLDALQTRPAWTPCHEESFRRVRAFLAEGWLLHERKEVTILFPVLENFLPRDIGPLDVLRNEFAQITQEGGRLVQTGSRLGLGDLQPGILREFQRAARSFAQLLRDHIYKEDRIFFPMIARQLTPERDAELLARMTACCASPKPIGT
jgi:hemerythrin-like domain-containing protein